VRCTASSVVCVFTQLYVTTKCDSGQQSLLRFNCRPTFPYFMTFSSKLFAFLLTLLHSAVADVRAKTL